MIDARRMEVFTALYDEKLTRIMDPGPMILDSNAFNTELNHNKILFSGSGAVKMLSFSQNPHILVSNEDHSAADMVTMAWAHYRNREFADLAYSEPFYVKAFYQAPKKTV